MQEQLPPKPNEVITPSAEPTTAPDTPTSQPASELTEPTPSESNQNIAEEERNLPPLVSWEASEYISHQHGPMWYLAVFGITAAIVALLGLVLKEWLSALVVVLMAVALVIYARRAPRTLRYTLNEAGIAIGQKFYPYSQFRSFALITDSAFLTVELDPLQRFMPRLSMFLDKDDVDSVTDTLEQHLPRNERKADAIDRLSRKLKF